MTELENRSNNELYQLLSLIANDTITEEDDLFDSKNELIKVIVDEITDVGYDGDNNYDSMLWYVKGLHMPKPKKLTRYIDNNDDYFMKNLKNNINRGRAKDDSYVKKPKTYQLWKQQHDDPQMKTVNDIMKKLDDSPHNWYINFEELNNNGRMLLLPRLKKFFESVIAELPITGKYKVVFKVNGNYYSKPLSPTVYKKLMDNLIDKNFIFNIDEQPPEYFYEQGSMELPAWSLFSWLAIKEISKESSYNDRGGSFFNYLVTNDVPVIVQQYLTKLQIFNSLVNKYGKQREELNDCCFIYALMQTNDYTPEELNNMRLRIQNRYLSQKSIASICEEFSINITLNYINDDAAYAMKKRKVNNKGIKNAKHNHTFNIYQNHYFIEEKTPFSTYYIKHLSTMNDSSKSNMEYKQDHWIKARSFITSSNLVRELFKGGYFREITYGECSVLSTVFYNEVNSDISNIQLEYDDSKCTQLIEPMKRKNSSTNDVPSIYYADFEADVTGPIHVPYLCVVQSEEGNREQIFKGVTCGTQLLNYLPNNATVYFHNLAYDIRFLACYGIRNSIIKGTKMMKCDVVFNHKVIHFRDTLPILSSKLSQLPSMFGISDIHKEIFPYKYYTIDRLTNGGAIGIINEAGNDEDKKWTIEDKQQFINNINSINGCRISDSHKGSDEGAMFDMWKYAQFYCQQDVRILRLSFTAFSNGFIKDFKIDPHNFISISSLANEVFNQHVYYNHNLYRIGGIVRKFCSHAIYGGRCMCAYNKKWHTTTPLCDFDAVSLYPSAMKRLYTVEGKPKVITPEQLNMDFLSTTSAYVVEIKITKVNKHYPFPLIVQKVNGINVNDDNIIDPITMVVDNIYLEDLINFQHIEFSLLRGYYWDGKKDYTIQDTISMLFNKRLEYKKQHNHLQQLYKLIMNSCYGKTIERPVEKDYKYLHEGPELEKYWYKNYNKIVEDIKLNNSNIHAVKVVKQIDTHFNFSLLGIQVLSMSKRIMNEVMCLAFDIGCRIYYQDTDSMHIAKDDLPKLSESYKQKYGRELIGSNLGQFHSDFPTINNHDEMPLAIESYFLMKKMYIDKLVDSTGDVDYMIRGKGLTLASIQHAAQSEYNNDYMKLYEAIYNGKAQMFDLTKGQPCFSMNKDMTVSTVEKFMRKIKTPYEEGNINDYH